MLKSKPESLNPKPRTLHPKPQILTPEPRTPNPKALEQVCKLGLKVAMSPKAAKERIIIVDSLHEGGCRLP